MNDLEKNWSNIQIQYFVDWVNLHLKKRDLQFITDLKTELSDGVYLIQLLEILTNEKLPRYTKKPKLFIQKLDNVQIAFEFMSKKMNIKVVGCNPQSIVEGNIQQIMAILFCLIRSGNVDTKIFEGSYSKTKFHLLSKSFSNKIEGDSTILNKEPPYIKKTKEEANKNRIIHSESSSQDRTFSQNHLLSKPTKLKLTTDGLKVNQKYQRNLINSNQLQIENLSLNNDKENNATKLFYSLNKKFVTTSLSPVRRVYQDVRKTNLFDESKLDGNVPIKIEEKKKEEAIRLEKGDSEKNTVRTKIIINKRKINIFKNQLNENTTTPPPANEILISPSIEELKIKNETGLLENLNSLSNLQSEAKRGSTDIKAEQAITKIQALVRGRAARIKSMELADLIRNRRQDLANHFSLSNNQKILIKLQRFWKSKIKENLEANKQRRNEIIKEILSTEQVYVKQLNVLFSVYINPLRNVDEEIISKVTCKKIFSEIEIIRNYNSLMLKSLEQRIPENLTGQEKLGDIFLRMIEFLKVYTVYVNNYNNSISTLTEALKNPKFSEFVEKAKLKPECELKEITDFLIMPIQRIPRYVLLLNDLCKHTKKSHLDFSDLRKALLKMKEVAGYVNEHKRDAENLNAVLNLRQFLIGKQEHIFNVSHRRLVRRGSLKKIVKGIEKNYYYFLFNDSLLEAKPVVKTFNKKRFQNSHKLSNSVNLTNNLESMGLNFKYKMLINLENCNLYDITEQESRPSFQLETLSEIMTFVTPSIQELHSWMSDIDGTISILFEKQVQKQGKFIQIKKLDLMVESLQIQKGIIFKLIQYPNSTTPVSKEGFLWKLSGNTWKLKWFAMKNDMVFYFVSKELSQKKDQIPSVIQIDNCCVVKMCLLDRPHCFQLITPLRIYFFSADSLKLAFEWVNELRRAIKEKINMEIQSPNRKRESIFVLPQNEEIQSIIETLSKIPGNSTCADCGLKQPRWVDVDFGVLICSECSGIHKRITRHSLVKSLNGAFDKKTLEKFKNLNNEKANAYYEQYIPFFLQRPTYQDSYQIKYNWIVAKYKVSEKKLEYSIGQFKKTGILLRKVYVGGKEDWKLYCFILKGKYLFYSKSIQKKEKKYIDLQGTRIIVGQEDCFEIVTPTQLFCLKCNNEKEKENWIRCLSNVSSQPRKPSIDKVFYYNNYD